MVDSNGCMDSNSYGENALSFDDYFMVYEPNVFTPNGDEMTNLLSKFLKKYSPVQNLLFTIDGVKFNIFQLGMI